jgi:hypothetical protein
MHARLEITFLLSAFILAGCSSSSGGDGQVDSLLPTGPTALATHASTGGTALTAQRAAPTVTREVLPVTLLVETATCPLLPEGIDTITGQGEIAFVFNTITNDNGLHVGVHVSDHGTAVDSNGAVWVWSDADLFFSLNSSSNSLEQTKTESFHLIGPKGQQVRIQGTFHITVVDGMTVVDLARGNATEENEACEGLIF